MKKILSLLAVAAAFSQPALAGDLSALGSLTQSEFRTLSEDLGAALSYKPVAPTAALGITGFDIGLEVTGTDISRSSGILAKAGASDSSMNTLLLPKLHVHKGLPLGFDVAAFVSNISPINANLVGGEVRYAILEGGLATPAIGVRAGFTSLNGASQLAFNTRSLDVSISKGFVLFTPYAGVGQVWVNSSPNVGALSSESFTQGKVFAGVGLNLGLLNFMAEADKTGDATSWSLKMALRW